MFFVCGVCQNKGLCVSEGDGEKYPPKTKESVQNGIYKQDIIGVLKTTSASYQAQPGCWLSSPAGLIVSSE